MNENGKLALRSIGDLVVYRKSGVCRIIDITLRDFGDQGKKEYYVLSSVYDNYSKIFIPVGSKLDEEMTELLSKKEINNIIDRSEKVETVWENDGKKRAILFDGIINGGTHEEIIHMVNELRKFKEQLRESKKMLKSNDSRYLSLGENIISGEFAYVLGKKKDEVFAYIDERLNK